MKELKLKIKREGLYSQISNNILENKRLIAIRNFLLPLLMNGQATIAE